MNFLFNFIQHVTDLGRSTRLSGLDAVPLLDPAELCDERANANYFFRVSGSMLDLNLAHIAKLSFQPHKLPELHHHKFWENVKSCIFTKHSKMSDKTANSLILLA